MTIFSKIKFAILCATLFGSSVGHTTNNSVSISVFDSVEKDAPRLVVKNPRHQKLLDTITQYGLFIKHVYQHYQENNKDYYEKFENFFHNNLINYKELLGLFYLLDTKRISSEDFLQKRLLSRLEYLHQRKTQSLAAFNNSDDHYFTVSTRPEILKEMADEGMLSDLNRIIAQETIDRYQFINMIIREIYILKDPYSYNPYTKKLISCSKALWPILRDGICDNLSDPDSAIYLYVSDSEDDFKDVHYFERNYLDLNKINPKHAIIQYETNSVVSKNNLDLPLQKPDFLYKKPTSISPQANPKVVDGSWISHLKRGHQKKSNKNKKNQNKKSTRESKNSAARFHKKSQQKVAKLVVEQVVKEEMLEHITSLSSTPVILIEEKKNDVEEQTSPPEFVNQPTSKVETTIYEDKSERPIESIISVHLSKKEEISSASKLSNKQWQTVYDAYYNPQKAKFKKLESVLVHFKGQVLSSSGGSHCSLFGPNGDIIGKTFRPHNGMKYRKDIINGWLDAFKALGIEKPEK